MNHADANAGRNTQRREKRKKKRRGNWLIKGIAIAIFLYLLLSVIFGIAGRMTTMVAVKGKIEEEVMVEGYIFREQHLVNAPAIGHLETRIGDGERVTEGQILGYVYAGEYDAEQSGKVRQLYDRIAQLQSHAAENIYAGNGVMVEQKIAVAARDLSDTRQRRDMSNLAAWKEELNVLIARKHAMNSGGAVDVSKELEDAKRKLWELETSMGNTKYTITAPAAGVFVAKIDGMEDKLTLKQAEEITPSYLRELDNIKIERKETIVENEPVCKVVNNYGWYFVANMDAEKAESLEIGSTVNIRFFDLSDQEITGTVRRISEEEKGKVAVSFYTNRYVEGIYASSRVLAEVVTTGVEGIKLPVKSIRVKDGQAGVYVLRLGVARFVPVSVKYKNEDWAIVSAVSGWDYQLQIYDDVIVDAKNLEDGKVVR